MSDEPALRPDAPIGETARRAVANEVTRIRLHTPGVLDGDEDAIHDLRVALRRLRAVLEAYGGCLDERAARRLRREAREAADALAPARDLDVLLGLLATFEPQGAAERHALDAVARDLRHTRRALADQTATAAATVASPRFGRRAAAVLAEPS